MPDLTTAQVAAELQVTPETVASYCKQELLPGSYRIGRHWRIPPKALESIRTPPPALLAPRSPRSVAQHRRRTA